MWRDSFTEGRRWGRGVKWRLRLVGERQDGFVDVLNCLLLANRCISQPGAKDRSDKFCCKRGSISNSPTLHTDSPCAEVQSDCDSCKGGAAESILYPLHIPASIEGCNGGTGYHVARGFDPLSNCKYLEDRHSNCKEASRGRECQCDLLSTVLGRHRASPISDTCGFLHQFVQLKSLI